MNGDLHQEGHIAGFRDPEPRCGEYSLDAESSARVSEDEVVYAASFRELLVYKEGMNLARQVFHAAHAFPKEETYSLTDQIRRSSRSITANIAEAWAKRSYEAHFVSKPSDSLAETYETQAWLDHAHACAYLTENEHQDLDRLANFVAAMIRNTSKKSASFCNSHNRLK